MTDWEDEWPLWTLRLQPAIEAVLEPGERLLAQLPFSYISAFPNSRLGPVALITDRFLRLFTIRFRRDLWSGRPVEHELFSTVAIPLQEIHSVQYEQKEGGLFLRVATPQKTLLLTSWEKPPFPEQRAQRGIDFALLLEQAVEERHSALEA